MSEQYVIQFIVNNKVPGEDKEKSRVTVTVPWQKSGVEVEVLKKATGKLEELPSHGSFKPERLVINLEVINFDTKKELTSFDPPIKLEVEYTAKDVENADGLNRLKLGYFHETKEEWKEFADQDDFRLDGDSEGGIGFATISSWGDRRIAYGH